jgi:hypothetical protein
VNAYGDLKTARPFNIRSGGMDQAGSGGSVYNRSRAAFQAWQIAAITKPFQHFAHYLAFPYLRIGTRAEDVKMSDKPLNSRFGRNAALAAFASLAVVVASASPSAAASAASAKAAIAAGQGSSNATDFSAARRHRYYRRGPNAAGLAFMGVAAGLIGGAIAESRRQEYYENNYYYGGPRYYRDPGYGYYGGGPRYYYNPY